MEFTIESIYVCMYALYEQKENMTWQGINGGKRVV